MSDYYHLRSGDRPRPKIGRPVFERSIRGLIDSARQLDYLQDAIGFHCPDDGKIAGRFGHTLSDALFRKAYISITDPAEDHLATLTKEELLGVVEVLYDIVAKGDKSTGRPHNYGGCGWHYRDFEKAPAQQWFRDEVKQLLECYDEGFELDESGRVQLLAPEHIAALLKSPLPPTASAERRARVDNAVRDFRNGRATWEQRLQQVNQLASVAENLRDQAKHHVRKDEVTLFQVFNEFGVRHLKSHEKIDYDRPVFLTYMFYCALATIHLCEQLLARSSNQAPSR